MRYVTAPFVLLLVIIAWPAAADAQSDVTINDLFRSGSARLFDLSPGGDFVAYQDEQRVYAGNEDVGYLLIYGFSEHLWIRNIEWTGPATLIIQTRNKVTGDYQLRAAKLGTLESGEFGQIDYRRHEVEGYIHDALLGDPDYVEFARVQSDEDVFTSELFRFDLFQKTAKNFKKRQRIPTGSKDLYYYLKDGSGRYTVGMRYVDGIPELWRQPPGTDLWAKLWTSPQEADFRPIQLSANGKVLWALTNAFTDKTAAVVVDVESGALKHVLFEHERFDLEGIVLSSDSTEPIAAVYREQGLLRYHFFAADAKRNFTSLQNKFPNKSIILLGESTDNSVVLVATSTSRDRGQIRRCNLPEDHCELLMSIAPWLDDKHLSETIVLDVPSESGATVDAFLTLPIIGGDSIPLVAMPHGGPIGVTDSRSFSPDVQWLAHNGYAVLQINYRGSGGYGRKFEDAGLKQWGRGIEDDIEAAVKLALREYPQLDKNRVGIYGASYGGYSALMSVIRNPDLFLCGASFAGVTDLTLIFTQAKMHKNDSLRKTMVKIIGSPIQDYEEQRENSPAYRYKEITRPILLAHGTDDFIVDIEHSWRLRKLMQLNGSDPEFIILDRVGHGFETTDEAEALYGPLISFLDKHLMP